MESSDCWLVAYKLISSGESKNAIELCESDKCSGALECQRFLGWTYYKQDSFEKALNWFSQAIEQGDAESLYGIGSVHFVERRFDVALQYYEKAADKGYSRAYHWIGYIYHQGLGVPRNLDLAMKCYKKGAAHGYLVAERALIHLAYINGNIFTKIIAMTKSVYIALKAAIIAYRNINDLRIVDIPNAFKKTRDVQLP
jgi:TPR repeat protein